jgi:alkylated DNA repair dioxygenase AlkB
MHLHPEQAELFDAGAALPHGLVYVPEFISPAEESGLLGEIARLPLEEARYKQYTARRRTISYGGSYDFEANALGESAPVPGFLHPLRERIGEWLDIPAAHFDHALVSEYRPGTPLGWHRDVPDFEVIAGVSLAAPCRMRFRPYPPDRANKPREFTLDLAPRSAYVMRGEARWGWQHSIPETKALRYSITFRTRRIRP